jgi:hypothetical protein
VQFLREQDGAPERLLKARLAELFMHEKAVQRAYLAQIRAGEQAGVALCIKAISGQERSLAQKVGAIFAAIFGAHEHLDILFLSDTQETSLKSVCSSFFSASADP